MSRHIKFSSIGINLTDDVAENRLYKTKRKVKHVSIHCSASPQGRGDDVFDIDMWHKDRWGSGVGYHFVVLENGTIQKGRWLDYIPSAVKGHNTGNIAVCFIGNDNPTEEQRKAVLSLCKILVKQYELKVDDVKGHNEFYGHASRGCPCGLDIRMLRRGLLTVS